MFKIFKTLTKSRRSSACFTSFRVTDIWFKCETMCEIPIEFTMRPKEMWLANTSIKQCSSTIKANRFSTFLSSIKRGTTAIIYTIRALNSLQNFSFIKKLMYRAGVDHGHKTFHSVRRKMALSKNTALDPAVNGIHCFGIWAIFGMSWKLYQIVETFSGI